MKAEDLKVGGVYEFKAGARRIVSFDVGKYNTYVVWEYADGVKRQGRTGGRTWKSSFASKAKGKEGGYCCYWFSEEERNAMATAARIIGIDEQDFVKSAIWKATKRVNRFLET